MPKERAAYNLRRAMAYSKKYKILGAPIPWKRAGVNSIHSTNVTKSVIYDTQKGVKFQTGLEIIATHKNSRQFQGPLLFEAIFFCPIPATSKDRVPGMPVFTTPDVSNLQKYIEDVMTDCNIYIDDKQIACVKCCKIYGSSSRSIIRISEQDNTKNEWITEFLEHMDEKP